MYLFPLNINGNCPLTYIFIWLLLSINHFAYYMQRPINEQALQILDQKRIQSDIEERFIVQPLLATLQRNERFSTQNPVVRYP